jgi:hypothetical protein
MSSSRAVCLGEGGFARRNAILPTNSRSEAAPEDREFCYVCGAPLRHMGPWQRRCDTCQCVWFGLTIAEAKRVGIALDKTPEAIG